MRVLQVTHYMPPHVGGIEAVAERLFRGYRDKGVSVSWMASRVPSDAPRRGPNGEIRITTLNAAERVAGVPVPIWSPLELRTVRRAVRAADVLHVHDALYATSAVAVREARRADKPVLLTQHIGLVPYASAVLDRVQRLGWRTLGQAVLDRADVLVAATPASAAFLAERCPGRTVHAVPNGLDLDRFAPVSPEVRQARRGELGLDPDRPTVLFVGRLVEKKGLPRVLAAARARPDLQWVVLGDGPWRDAVRDAPVRWPGAVAPGQIARWYQAADAFVLPSVGEGLPLTVQEAMAAGLPSLITADEVYARELVSAGAAVGVVGGDLAAAVASSEASWPSVGRRARAYAEANWSASACVDRYLALLAELTAR